MSSTLKDSVSVYVNMVPSKTESKRHTYTTFIRNIVRWFNGLKLSKLKIIVFYLLLIMAIYYTFIHLKHHKTNSIDQTNHENNFQEKSTDNGIHLNSKYGRREKYKFQNNIRKRIFRSIGNYRNHNEL